MLSHWNFRRERQGVVGWAVLRLRPFIYPDVVLRLIVYTRAKQQIGSKLKPLGNISVIRNYLVIGSYKLPRRGRKKSIGTPVK